MKLGKLVLENIKGIKKLTITSEDGGDISIYGTNGIGKTTIIDSMFWLLHDSSASGKKFNPKTLDLSGEEIHKLEHSAEGMFFLDDGQDITLKKIFKEQWVKTRGSVKKSFKGHETEYYIDGVGVKKKDYVSRAELIADQKTFKLLSDVDYFSGKMPWKERRKLVLEICGDISDDDVIKSDKNLKKLTDILGRHSVEDFATITKASMAKVNKKIDGIPARVDEATKAKVEVDGTAEDAKLLVDANSKLVSKAQGKLDSIKNCDVTKEQGELNALQLKINTAASKSDKEVMEAKELCDTKIEEHQAILDEFNPKIATLTADIEALKKAAENHGKTKEALYDEFNAVDSMQFDDSSLICPTCDKPATPGEAKAIKDKFNADKSTKLDDINTRGQKLNEQIDAVKGDINSKHKDLQTLEAKVKPHIDAITSLREKKKNVRMSKSGEKEVVELQNLAYEKQVEIDNIIAQVDESLIEKATKELEDCEAELKLSQTATQGFITNEAQDIRIAELVKEEEQLASDYEKLEGQLFLTEQFLVAKVKAMEGNISNKFNNARFKMFSTQINGGLKECCDVIVDGVPYGLGLNNAAEVNVGIDIINTLSRHYMVNVPIIIDNAESVVDVADSESQVIKLIVSGDDKSLRVEVDV